MSNQSDSNGSSSDSDDTARRLQELEKKFARRYSDEDSEYMAVVGKPLSDPPCMHPWQPSRNRYDGSRDRRSGDRNWHERRNRSYDDRRSNDRSRERPDRDRSWERPDHRRYRDRSRDRYSK